MRASAPHSRSTSNMRDGARFHQAAREFLPDALGHQRVDLAARRPWRASAPSVSGATAKVAKRAAKRASAQDAHRVFGEGGARRGAARCRCEVALAAERVDQRAVFASARHGVDGEVAPRQVLLERDVGRGVEREAVVAGRGLALGARQRVFLVRLRDAGTPGSPCRPGGSPRAPAASGVAPTTTQSRSLTGRPSSASRTAPPTT